MGGHQTTGEGRGGHSRRARVAVLGAVLAATPLLAAGCSSKSTTEVKGVVYERAGSTTSSSAAADPTTTTTTDATTTTAAPVAIAPAAPAVVPVVAPPPPAPLGPAVIEVRVELRDGDTGKATLEGTDLTLPLTGSPAVFDDVVPGTYVVDIEVDFPDRTDPTSGATIGGETVARSASIGVRPGDHALITCTSDLTCTAVV